MAHRGGCRQWWLAVCAATTATTIATATAIATAAATATAIATAAATAAAAAAAATVHTGTGGSTIGDSATARLDSCFALPRAGPVPGRRRPRLPLDRQHTRAPART